MEAAKIFTQVSVTKREAEINLDNEEFDERAKVYRRKDWILKGLNPDLMEAEWVFIEILQFYLKLLNISLILVNAYEYKIIL